MEEHIKDRRGLRRFIISLPVLLRNPHLNKASAVVEAETLNIAFVGLCILQHTRSDFVKLIKAARRKNRFTTEIILAPPNGRVKATGEIIWFDTPVTDHQTSYHTGFFLMHIDEEDRVKWKKFLSELSRRVSMVEDSSEA